jgi:hypothetical protein
VKVKRTVDQGTHLDLDEHIVLAEGVSVASGMEMAGEEDELGKGRGEAPSARPLNCARGISGVTERSGDRWFAAGPVEQQITK